MNPQQTAKLNAIRSRLEAHHKHVVEQFHRKHAITLKKAKKHTLTIASAAIMATAVLAQNHAYTTNHLKQLHKQEQERVSLDNFVSQIKDIIYNKKTLSPAEENVIADALSKKFHLNLKANLQGHHLNEIYGYVGAEQHLRRWAGDTLSQHGLQRSGMAPLQGSFKDFDNAEQEKYYVAVQLHELPDWNQHWSTLKPWYRFRKVFVYNPANQKGIIAVIGDSGPSKFTGKTFGGSPEIMEYLEMKDGGQKGKAIILFVDDPENRIALGPTGHDANKLLVNK